MTVRIQLIDGGGAVVTALLSHWQAIGRFLHVRLAERLKTALAAQAAQAITANPVRRDSEANPVRQKALGRRPYTLLEARP